MCCNWAKQFYVLQCSLEFFSHLNLFISEKLLNKKRELKVSWMYTGLKDQGGTGCVQLLSNGRYLFSKIYLKM